MYAIKNWPEIAYKNFLKKSTLLLQAARLLLLCLNLELLYWRAGRALVDSLAEQAGMSGGRRGRKRKRELPLGTWVWVWFESEAEPSLGQITRFARQEEFYVRFLQAGKICEFLDELSFWNKTSGMYVIYIVRVIICIVLYTCTHFCVFISSCL